MFLIHSVSPHAKIIKQNHFYLNKPHCYLNRRWGRKFNSYVQASSTLLDWGQQKVSRCHAPHLPNLKLFSLKNAGCSWCILKEEVTPPVVKVEFLNRIFLFYWCIFTNVFSKFYSIATTLAKASQFLSQFFSCRKEIALPFRYILRPWWYRYKTWLQV